MSEVDNGNVNTENCSNIPNIKVARCFELQVL